jgi:hypothetical protein
LGAEGRGSSYHPSREWLQTNGYNPDKAKSIEIGNVAELASTSDGESWIVLRLLALAYYDQVLGQGHEGVRAAFHAAEEGGSYDSVRRSDGQEERAPALKSEWQYFAEGTEAFFGTNEHYPFVRDELRRHDPKLFEVLEEVWVGS